MPLLVFAAEDVTLGVGRYAGELLADVADEDPSHLRKMLQSSQLTHQEGVAIREALDINEEEE